MKQILNRLFDHQSLTKNEATEVMSNMATGQYNEAQIAAFISVYLMRSIELDEIIGFRDALLSMAVKVDLSDFVIMDIVGTGGDGKNTFNISTAACFVVAGAGYQIAKHGNYAATSVSGSSNVLEYFGAKFTADESVLKTSLYRSGFAYLHAPVFNPAMKHVAPVRKNLGVRTFFNMLGPLINPAQPKYQCLGVFNLKMMRLYSYIYQRLGAQYTIVHSLDGYDEISLTNTAKIINNSGEFVFTPEELGFNKIEQQALWGGATVQDAASIFLNVLENKATEAQKDVVIINAAMAIQTRCPLKTINECKSEAMESLQSGAAVNAFRKFINHNT
ncbi:MAG: anthranilate phosphoribosyltransferase [Paludibacter sp.]|nr:anthranilate phosphoribosyltransferase [Paludibacter sp.]MDD4199463.1 anthranilate phosphoribosyltransferase [Paludibacter sp.]MDD4428718.1 anthranilate phosphoribosyltransferase [Paludibacter sp.]